MRCRVSTLGIAEWTSPVRPRFLSAHAHWPRDVVSTTVKRINDHFYDCIVLGKTQSTFIDLKKCSAHCCVPAGAVHNALAMLLVLLAVIPFVTEACVNELN